VLWPIRMANRSTGSREIVWYNSSPSPLFLSHSKSIGLAQDPANAKHFEERATKLGLDAAWALESAKHLSGYLAKACEDTKEAKGVIMGLFE